VVDRGVGAVTQRSEVLPLIRTLVRDRLTASPAYKQLSAEKRAQVAHDTVNALSYILGGEDGTMIPTGVTLGGNAEAFAPVQGKPVPVRRAGQGAAMPQFGTSARQGEEAFTDLIEGVNFPAFVGGLIDGVFNSIVTTSIKQMEAYAEMVKNVSKSVDQYMKDNVSEDNARDYLVEKYPDHLEFDASGEKPVVKPKEGADDSMPDFFADLGLKAPITSLDEETVEQQLVPAARYRIAMDRQQLLATMVMMGVNRLVVTNGTIEASCFFELDTTDLRKAHDQRTTESDRTTTQTRESGKESTRDWSGDWSKSGLFSSKKESGKHSGKDSWYSKSNYNDTAKFNVKTLSTRDAEETIKMHAELGGKVKVNFKSDYFPMEKMVDILQVQQIREKTAAGIAPQAPAPPLPALPAMPALPSPGAK